MFHNTSPKEKLEIILQLAELCIELIQQNEEHHAEVSTNKSLMVIATCSFLSFSIFSIPNFVEWKSLLLTR